MSDLGTARLKLATDRITADPEAILTPRTVSTLRTLALSLRPHQWVKNSLLFGGLIFSRSLSHWDAVSLAVGAFFAFCMASSAVYLLNDLRDLKEDRMHPVKRLRPLASGVISPSIAKAALMILMISSGILAFGLGIGFGMTLSIYVLINLAYSIGLKRVVILDVMIVALCFVLRAVAGAVVIGVKASAWLILCTLMMALLVCFGKRRHEIVLLQANASNHRASLEQYSIQFLDLMMAISGGAALVTYALYTMAEETVQRFGSRGLMLTVPFVVYGVFRYLFLVHLRKDGGDPARLLVSDRPILLNGFLWVSVVCLVLYGNLVWIPW